MSTTNIEGCALAPQQRRLWTLQAEGGTAFTARCAVELDGPLDVARLDRAVVAVQERHQALRTRFVSLAGMTFPLQTASAAGATALRMSTDAARDVDEALDALAAAVGPPMTSFAAELVRRGPDRHVLLIAAPSLCMDTRSLWNAAADVVRAYSGDTPVDPVQFSQVVDWFNEAAASEDADVARSESRVASADLTRLAIPFARPSTSFSPRTLLLDVPPELVSRLARIAADAGGDLRAAVLAAWEILLWRLSGQPGESALLVAGDGRPMDELQDAVGPFSRMVPTLTDVAGSPSFRDLITAVAARVADVARLSESLDLSHPEFARLREGRGLPCAFEWCECPALQAPSGLRLSMLRCVSFNEPFTTMLSATAAGDAVSLSMHYDSGTLEQRDALLMRRRLLTLFHEAAANPERRIGELTIVDAEEQRLTTETFNQTSKTFAAGNVLHRLFEQQVRKTPNAPAVVAGTRVLTYVELDKQANELARRVTALGAGPAAPVALLVERSIEMVVGMLATLKAGAPYIPVDAEYPTERVSYMLQHGRPAVLLTQSHLPRIEAGASLPTIDLDLPDTERGAERDTQPAVDVSPDDPAYILYTSGSTGRPKAVVVPHRAIANHMHWMQAEFPLEASDRVLQKTPFSFDASVWEFYAPLLAGGTLVMAEPGGHRDSAYLARTIQEHAVTILQLIPTHLRFLLDEPSFAAGQSLRRVFCGGEALTAELQRRFFERHHAELINLYGPTEATIDATYWVCRRDDLRATIGRPVANTRIYILDSMLRPVPLGSSGEIYIGGRGLALGYLHDARLTEERFIADPFVAGGERIYRTGDLGRFAPDGTIEFLGRIDHQIKLRGFRIELGEIEAVLEEHPAVKQAVVVVRETPGAEQQLVAYVLMNERVPMADVRAAVAQRLPQYMLPAVWVPLDSLPLLPNGKVDRNGLPDADKPQSDTSKPFVAPGNLVESRLVEIWSEVLKVERIGVTDDFFELGGHSLNATQVVSRIRKVFQLEVPLRDFFEAPTIKAMADVILAAQVGAGGDDSSQFRQVLAEVERLSDREARERLDAR